MQKVVHRPGFGHSLEVIFGVKTMDHANTNGLIQEMVTESIQVTLAST